MPRPPPERADAADHRSWGGKPMRGGRSARRFLERRVKNPTENRRHPHPPMAPRAARKDAVALARFPVLGSTAEGHQATSPKSMPFEALETFSAATPPRLKDVSFPTISRQRARNGAIVHYRVTRKDQPPRHPGELLLIDSRRRSTRNGTTDVTAHHCGRRADGGECATASPPCCAATSRCKRRARVFPDGTPPARRSNSFRPAIPCGRPGSIFEHGTGHGVGRYLSVP